MIDKYMNIIPIITIEKSAKKGPDIIENGNNKKIYSFSFSKNLFILKCIFLVY